MLCVGTWGSKCIPCKHVGGRRCGGVICYLKSILDRHLLARHKLACTGGWPHCKLVCASAVGVRELGLAV